MMRQRAVPLCSEEVAADIKACRGSDTVVRFSIAPILDQPDLSALDAFVQEIGLHAIGPQWRKISRKEAASLAAFSLARDLAYGVQLVADSRAGELAERFVSLFDEGARFFTNRGDIGDWMPLTGSTFDLGVLGIDQYCLGVLVVQDED